MGVLDRLQTSSGDVVMFYYSGHGTRSVQDESDYPQMCLGSHYDNEFVPLEYVLRRLEDMPARLKIVFGDCCNSVAPLVEQNPQSSVGKQVTIKRNPFEMSGFSLFCQMSETQRSAEY